MLNYPVFSLLGIVPFHSIPFQSISVISDIPTELLSTCNRTKVNPKPFAICILTAIANIIKMDGVKIGIANALELPFIL